LRFLPASPRAAISGTSDHLLLLTNGRGGMARLAGDFGAIRSKYDCVLGANLDAERPVDRHVLVKRVRAWLQTDHFSYPIDGACLTACHAGPPARWHFHVPGGNGRTVAIEVEAAMPHGSNATAIRFRRRGGSGPLPGRCRLIVRVDLEDRSFHAETSANQASDHHFSSHLHAAGDHFTFTPAADRRLSVSLSGSHFHNEAEWCHDIPHPVEGSRGQRDRGDAWSPGWFSADISDGEERLLLCNAEHEAIDPAAITAALTSHTSSDDWGARLDRAADAYVVRRDGGSSVIAGYPWFLDWGRDTLICARGLLAAGRDAEVLEILRVFGAFEDGGTLPNCIHGADASNRETSDAALWYAVVVEELAQCRGPTVYDEQVSPGGRSLGQVLHDLACGHLAGTSTGVRVDHDSGLVWSPSHFTWMDTNHPAGTPRCGYPIEIQVLWWRLLRQLANRQADPAVNAPSWADLADRVRNAIDHHYWCDERGWWADQLVADSGESAAAATVDRSLRSNCLHVPALGLDTGPRAQRCVQAAIRHLIVPGAIRSLAPLPVDVPLLVPGPDGQPLIDPHQPYQGHYQGDEDTQRKPAYHNGTAWTWPYPVFCEALLNSWAGDPRARAAARSYLLAMQDLADAGCLEQIPEIIDGDAPHTQRGCDAQAWGVTEALRVWRLVDD
jgi:predicted glycogen debranching enzyme